MLQTSDNIEASTMTYVFDMFGKSVTQMLQASIHQQTAIDELRQQIRSCQTQITNICGTLEDFEDRMSVKLQEMRPTIYTRDGIPLDDALELLQNKVQSSAEKSISQDETLARLESEVKGKLDIEEYQASSQAANESNDSFTNMSLSIQELQKELQKQRSEQDQMMDKCSQLIQIQIQRLKTQSFLSNGGFDNSDEFVTKAKFKEVIEKLRKESMKSTDENEFDDFDENDLEGTLNRIKKHSAKVDEEYRNKKAKLDENLNKVLNMLGENNEEEDENINDSYFSSEIEVGSEFEFEATEKNDTEVRDIGIQSNEDNNDAVEVGETRIQAKGESSTRRSIAVNCQEEQEVKENQENQTEGDKNEPSKKKTRKKKSKKLQSNTDQENMKSRKEALIEEAMKEKERIDKKVSIDQSSSIDPKLTASIISQVMNKIEPVLVEMFSTSGIGGVKLDKSEARELITQLSTLNQLKEEMAKMKMLISIKFDRADAENELSIRITRDEFFSMLMTLFPSNSLVQKAYSSYKKKLPPLKNPPQNQSQSQLQTQQPQLGYVTDKERSKSRGDDFDDRHSVSIHQRQIKTAAPAQLVPARNSKLLALNQKFLKGADGKYYLRDINTSDSSANMQSSNVVGSLSKSASISADQAFDFQPFLPASTVKEQVGRISVPSQHRARTPPDQND